MEVKSDAVKSNIACIGMWNVRSMNQGKLEVVKQEMAESQFLGRLIRSLGLLRRR